MAKPPPEKPTPKPDTKTKPVKRRNWRRRFVILSSVLLILGWVLNGPFARWALHYGIDGAMTSLGTQGDVRVEGTILSGLSLHEMSYKGNEGISSIDLEQLDLEYHVSELLDGKIRGLDMKGLKLVIDYAQFPETEATEGDDTAALRQSLATLRPYFTSPRINISDVDIHLLNDGEKSAHFQFSSLNHKEGSGIYQLTRFQASDAENQQTPRQDAVLTWQPESATVDRLEVLPEIVLEKLTADWADQLKGEARLLVDGAAIDIQVTDSITIELEKGEIRSQFFDNKFSLDLPTDFVVASLRADIASWDQAIPHWQVNGKLHLKSLDVEDYRLRKTEIELSQKDTRYQIGIVGEVNGARVQSSARGSWTAPESDTWWGETKLDYDIKSSQLATLAKPWIDEALKIDLSAMTLTAKGHAELRGTDLTQLTASGTTKGTRVHETTLPDLSFDTRYQANKSVHAKIRSGTADARRLDFTGTYFPDTENYQGSLEMNEPDTSWLNAVAKIFDAPVSLKEHLQLEWKGQGNVDLKKPQTGNLDIKKIALSTPDVPLIHLKGKTTYDWPKSTEITDLEVQEGDWEAKATLTWDGKTLDLKTMSLTNKEETVATVKGSIPASTQLKNKADFFNQQQPWKLRIESKPIAVEKINSWLQLELAKDISGKAAVDLDITGSPSSPDVRGRLQLLDVTGLDAAQREALDAVLSFHSENQHLHVTGNITEGKNQRLNGKFTLPFEPDKLVNHPDQLDDWLESAEIEGETSINTLALERFSRFIPELKKIEGNVSGTAKISGTVTDPKYLVKLEAKAPLIQIRESDIGDIKDAVFDVTIDHEHQVKTSMTARINGGDFKVSGTADLTDLDNPKFDIGVTARYALVHRDDLISVRAHSDLRILGSLEDATISGKIGIVESLVYKDMELIPIGVPSSEVAKVQLPSLDAEKVADGLPVPAPFGDWKLNLTISTTDPILIRGNVASGSIRGSLKVNGTMANPRPNGTLIAKDVKAKLPFSILNVKRGEIRFTPDDGLDPTLSIRGKSTVGSHDVSVFVYGSASSPKTTLTSYPPLPETEIMSLLGTGTTTSGLEDRDVATFKAFQVFLLKLKKRVNEPGGNKLFRELLKGVDDLNLNVGEKDRFTGRKYSSATIELHQRWHLTAQVDAQQQTRGLIVYVIRFR